MKQWRLKILLGKCLFQHWICLLTQRNKAKIEKMEELYAFGFTFLIKYTVYCIFFCYCRFKTGRNFSGVNMSKDCCRAYLHPEVCVYIASSIHIEMYA